MMKAALLYALGIGAILGLSGGLLWLAQQGSTLHHLLASAVK